jgi:hypothetical protein
MANERLKILLWLNQNFHVTVLFISNFVEKTIQEKNAPNNIHPIGGSTHGIVTGGCLTNT